MGSLTVGIQNLRAAQPDWNYTRSPNGCRLQRRSGDRYFRFRIVSQGNLHWVTRAKKVGKGKWRTRGVPIEIRHSQLRSCRQLQRVLKGDW